MEDQMDSVMMCSVCLIHFDLTNHKPLLLPKCGHSFCSYCLDVLHKQSKTACPECRKENAVTSVASLPINFSLLSLVQSKGPATSDSPTTSNAPSSQQSQRPTPKSSVPCAPASAGRQGFLSHVAVRPKAPTHHQGGMSNPPRQGVMKNWPREHSGLEGRRNASHSDPSEISDRETALRLQEELDFQMAIHLTFCKDKSHRHDDPISAQNCWQFPADEELNKVVSQSFR